MSTIDTFVAAPRNWLHQQRCEVIRTNETVVHADFVTWRKTLTSFALTSVKSSASPHAVPWGFARTALFNGNKVHVQSARLEQALLPYAEVSAVLGLKLSRLTQGNTRLMAFVSADNCTPRDIESILDLWIERAPTLQSIGRSPGQTLGEVTVSLYTLA